MLKVRSQEVKIYRKPQSSEWHEKKNDENMAALVNRKDHFTTHHSKYMVKLWENPH